jgi:hypothetical protein
VTADVVDRQDIRVVEPPGGARFLLEPMHPQRVSGKPLRNQLECHLAIEAWIPSAVDIAHAAGAQPSHDLIGSDAGALRDWHARSRYGVACVMVDINCGRAWKVRSNAPM